MMTPSDAATNLVEQLVSHGVSLAPSFRSEFESLASRTGVQMFPHLAGHPLDLQILDELTRFCESLEGKVALERLWHRAAEGDYSQLDLDFGHKPEVLV